MFKFASLFSGSSGNAQFIAYKNTRLLIDAGVSGKLLEQNLRRIGEDPSEIDAILITHEHSDHIKGAGIFSRRYNLPVYASAKTWEAMKEEIGKIKEENKKIFQKEQAFVIRDLTITAFKTSHDAADPSGFRIETDGKKFGFATDTGVVTEAMREHLLGSDLVYLECNHDIGTLETGPYPYLLKMRIKSSKGHLCNDDSADFAKELYDSGTRRFVLGHLSKENNYPLLAESAVSTAISPTGYIEDIDAYLEVAPRSEPSRILHF